MSLSTDSPVPAQREDGQVASHEHSPPAPALGAPQDDLAREWVGSPEELRARASRGKSKTVAAAFVVVSVVATAGALTLLWLPTWVLLTLVGIAVFAGYVAVIAIVAVFTSYTGARRRFLEREEMVARVASFRHAADRIEDELSLESVTLLNVSMLDGYHDIVKLQAERSFKNSQRAMIAGLFILILGAVGVIAAPDASTKLALAALSGLGTTISGYIGRTFLASHAAAIAQLNRFFQQPLVNSYLLHAERVTRNVTSKRGSELLAEIVMESIATARAMGAPVAPDPGLMSRRRSSSRAYSSTETAQDSSNGS